MGQLEPQLRAVLRGRLKSLLVDRGMTSIFVTHDQTEANALADRIAVMEGGVLQQFASPEGSARAAGQSVCRDIRRRAADERVRRQGRERRRGFASRSTTGRPSTSPTRKCRRSVRRDRQAGEGRDRRSPARRAAWAPARTTARVVSNQWLGDQSHLAMEVAGKLMVAVIALRRFRRRPAIPSPIASPRRICTCSTRRPAQHLARLGALARCSAGNGSSMSSRYPDRHRCWHLRHQVGRLYARGRTNRGRGSPQCLRESRRRPGRTGHGAHLGDCAATLRELGRARSEPRAPRRGPWRHRAGRRLMADRRRRRAGRRGITLARFPRGQPRRDYRRSDAYPRPLRSHRLWPQRLHGFVADGVDEALATRANRPRRHLLSLQGLALFPADRRSRDRSVRGKFHLRQLPHPKLRGLRFSRAWESRTARACCRR